MADNIEAKTQELNELKLQLNAAQQTIANYQLKLTQKDEIVLKTQADADKEAQAYKTEIKKLRDQLNEKSKIIENTSTSELQEAVKVAQENETKALRELKEIKENNQKLTKLLEEFEKTAQTHSTEYQKLNELHETVKGNLATLEMAFHDVIQKYERTKNIIEGFKGNEKIFTENVDLMRKSLKVEQQRYDSLKAHAKSQIEKANKENIALKQKYEQSELKQNAIIKRLEIKVASLQTSLEQKTTECAELAALCDEVTGKKV